MSNYFADVTAEDMKALTNRQLLKEYRTDKEHLKDLRDMKAKGSKTYLGDPLFRHMFHTTKSIALAEQELTARGYNLDTLTRKKPGKPKNNEQLFRAMFKDLHPLEIAILRERVQRISYITRKGIEKKPSDFDNPIFNHHHYLAVCDKIDKHLGS